MSGRLSQNDIDALFTGAVPEAAATLSVVPYDFARPPRPRRGAEAAVATASARLAAAIETQLARTLRVELTVSLAAVERIDFAELRQALETPCIAFTFGLGAKLAGEGLLELTPTLALRIVDRQFGGPGESVTLGRALSAIEETVVRGVARDLVRAVGESWRTLAPVAPELDRFVADPSTLAIAAADADLIVATFDVHWGDADERVSVALPAASLDPHVEAATTPRVARATAEAPDAAPQRQQVASALRHARVTVAARLPVVWLPARAVLALVPGEVLHTELTTDTPVEVHVNGRMRWLGALGQLRRHVGLRITQPVDAATAERSDAARPGRHS